MMKAQQLALQTLTPGAHHVENAVDGDNQADPCKLAGRWRSKTRVIITRPVLIVTHRDTDYFSLISQNASINSRFSGGIFRNLLCGARYVVQ